MTDIEEKRQAYQLARSELLAAYKTAEQELQKELETDAYAVRVRVRGSTNGYAWVEVTVYDKAAHGSGKSKRHSLGHKVPKRTQDRIKRIVRTKGITQPDQHEPIDVRYPLT